MKRTRWLGLSVFILPLLLAAPVTGAPATSADSPLAQIPADAPIVIQLHGYERVKDRVFTMLKNALPDLGPVVQGMFEEKLKEMMNGRELKGLAKDGPAFVVFTEVPKMNAGAPPPFAVIVRITKYQDFIDGMLTEDERKALKSDPAGYQSVTISNEETFFIDRKGYLVVTPNKDVAALLSQMHAGLDGKLDKEVAKKLLDSDVSAYVNMAAVNKEYGELIQQGKQFFDLALDQAAGTGQVDKNQIEMSKKIFSAVFQFEEDSRAILISADFRPEGLALHTQIAVGADTKSNDLLKSSQPDALDDLHALPAGQMSYFAAKLSPEVMKAMGPWMQGQFGEQNATLAQALKQQIEAGPERWLGSAAMPMQGIQVWKYKDPAKATDSQLKLFQGIQAGETFQNVIVKGKPEVKVGAQTHRGFKLNTVSMEWDFEKLAEKTPGAKDAVESIKKYVGEGIKTWFGDDGKTYVAVNAKDWESAKRQLDAYLDGTNTIGKHKAFADARKQLPAAASIVGLADAPLMAKFMGEMMQSTLKALGKEIDVSDFKPVSGKSYLGMSMTLQPEKFGFDLWLPGSAVADIRKLVEPLFNN